MLLKNKTVSVTGGGRAIGRACWPKKVQRLPSTIMPVATVRNLLSMKSRQQADRHLPWAET